MHIPLLDLRSQYQAIKQEIATALEDELENMQLFLSPQTQAFEHEFATYCGCRYGVGATSGTDALALALRACDIGLGDEVITVAKTFIATIEAITGFEHLAKSVQKALEHPGHCHVCHHCTIYFHSTKQLSRAGSPINSWENIFRYFNSYGWGMSRVSTHV